MPGDRGEHHVNEQEPEYWRELFAAHGFRMYDTIRPLSRVFGRLMRGIDNSFPYAKPENAARPGFDRDIVEEPRRVKSYEPMLRGGDKE